MTEGVLITGLICATVIFALLIHVWEKRHK